MKSKVCILSFSNIKWDARVLREIEAASDQYDVDVIGYGDWQAKSENVRFFSLPRSKTNVASVLSKYTRVPLGYLFPVYWEKHFWQKQEYHRALQILLRERYDLIHANDWDSLPVAACASQQVGSRILFDAHEYTPSQAADRWMVRFFNLPVRVYLLKKYLGSIKKAITVSDGLQRLYQDHFGFSTEIIMNAPLYMEHGFRPVNPEEIQLIHHGGAMRSRSLGDFVELAALLEPRFKMNFMLLPSEPEYLKKLKTLANQVAPGRIVFHEPVRPHEISRELMMFDLGIPLMRANTLSYLNALPNKFFDYVMAGLGIAVSPLPSMQKIVEEGRIGVVSVDQSVHAMANALNALTAEQINIFKRNSLVLAKSLNAEVEMKKLMNIYEEILKK